MTPQLYVFAGPNGAGKSTLSSSMVPDGTPIFDGDKEFALLRKNYSSTDSGTLYDAVNGHIFEDWKTRQIQTMTDCAFETNFRSEEVMNSVQRFKQSGFDIRLLFFGLDSIEAAIERVKLRVAGGGHDVSLENIKANYTKGLRNLGMYFANFDSVDLLQNFAKAGEAVQITPLMKIVNGNIIEQIAQQPQWVRSFVELSLVKKTNRQKRKGLGL